MEDMLSNLPQPLLCHILSKLSTRESVGTSVLSSHWRNIWSHVPVLDLDCQNDHTELRDFIVNYMNSNPKLAVETFKLIYDANEHSDDDFGWALNEVIRRRVTHIHVRNHARDFVRMPLSLYSSKTLADLNLYRVIFDHPGSELVSLPCLKTLYLEDVKFDGHLVLETFITGCSVLEDLTLVDLSVVFDHPSLPRLKTLCLEAVKFGGQSVMKTLILSCSVLENLTVIAHPDDNPKVVCFRSQSLKYFKLEARDFEDVMPDVEIDAPRLEYMCITDYRPESFIIKNIGQFAKVKMGVVFEVQEESMVPNTRNFVIGISKFKEMTICVHTLTSIVGYSEWEPLPPFSNLTHLDASLANSPGWEVTWEELQVFLSCCMNLQSLILEFSRLPKIEEIKKSPLPQCVRSSLKFLKLKAPNTPALKMLAAYFGKNCPALKKIILSEYDNKKYIVQRVNNNY